MRRGRSMRRHLHKTSYTSVFSRTCQGAAAVPSDSPSLSLTGKHSTGAVMALCKLILSWLSHQLQWEWREVPFHLERGSHGEWWLQRKRWKPSLRVEDSGKRTNFGLPFPPWLGFMVASAMESNFETCFSFIHQCCLLKCQAAGEPSTTSPEAGPHRMCLEVFMCTFIYEAVTVIVSTRLYVYSYL